MLGSESIYIIYIRNNNVTRHNIEYHLCYTIHDFQDVTYNYYNIDNKFLVLFLYKPGIFTKAMF
jgi:hypothetical protein